MFILHLLLLTTGGAVYEASIGAVSIRTEPWRLHWVLQRSRLSRPCWGRGEERNQYILLLRWNKKSTLHWLCSGEIHFEPSVQEVQVFNSTGKNKVCDETVRWNPLLPPQKYECLKQIQLLPRKEGCTESEIFGGEPILLTPHDTTVHVPGAKKRAKGVRCCEPILCLSVLSDASHEPLSFPRI